MAPVNAPFSWPNNSLSSSDLGQRGAVDGDARLVGAAAVAMNGARHQFLAGAALARDQHRGVPFRHAADELINVAHARAVAHHVVLNIHLGLQAAIFLLEPLHAARIVEREGGDTADGGQQLQVIFVETYLRVAGVQVNNAQDAIENFQRHRQNAADMTHRCALGVRERLRWPADRCTASPRHL